MTPTRFALPLLLALAAAPASATDDDLHFWGSATVAGPVKGDVLLWLEGQARAGYEDVGFRQIIIRPAVGVKLGEKGSAYIGYAFVRTGDERDLQTENRFWQQLGYTIWQQGRAHLTGRTRMEERLFEGDGALAWRLRQQVRLDVKLGGKGLRGVVWSEPFINLNAPLPGMRTGVDRWRNWAGVHVPITDKVAVEPGYLNQYVRRRGTDLQDHVINIAFVMRW